MGVQARRAMGRGAARSAAERDLIQRKFAVLGSYIKQLEYETGELTRMAQRYDRTWQIKVTTLCQSVDELTQSHNNYRDYVTREMQEEMHTRLLGAQPNISDEDLNYALQQSQYLEQASSTLDGILSTAGETFDSLVRQRATLQHIHKGVINVANSLGLSTNLIRMIERKETFNSFLTYGGMILTCIIVYVVWRWSRSS